MTQHDESTGKARYRWEEHLLRILRGGDEAAAARAEAALSLQEADALTGPAHAEAIRRHFERFVPSTYDELRLGQQEPTS
jgi:hypothetical protein